MEQDSGAGGGEAGVLVPLREQAVEFYGDTLRAAQTADETIYVPLRPICDHLGLDWASQYQRLRRDTVLADEMRSVVVTTTDRGRRAMVCLPLDLLPGWLFGINAARVKSELQAKITRYRRECFRVLWQAFRRDIVPAPEPIRDLSGAALALEIATAVQHLAQQQLALEAELGQVAGQMGQMAGRQEVMAEYLRGFIQRTEGRLTSLELQLSAGATINEAQAAEIALAVKNVGQRLAAQGDHAGYAKVYSELYRRYRISSYKNLPAARYQEVLDWLHGWHEELRQG